MRRFRFIHRGPEGPEEIEVVIDGARCLFSARGKKSSATAVALPDGRLSMLFDDGRQVCGRATPGDGREVEVVTASSRHRVALAEPLRDRIAHAQTESVQGQSDEEIRALMPGRVVEIAVAEGASVSAGDLILVLEAMKMQNEIRCSAAGTVVRLAVEPGRAVDGGALLALVRSS